MEYWEECISESFEDAGIVATEEQINIVASWIEGAHDNYGMAHGHDCIPNPLVAENERMAKAHKDEIERLESTHYRRVQETASNTKYTKNRLISRVETLQEQLTKERG